MNIIAIYLGAYFLLLIVISILISRKQTSEDFLIASRDRKRWQIFASKLATAVGAGYFITYAGFAYEYGWGVFTLSLGVILGFPLFAFWAGPKIHELSKNNKFYTLGDFVFERTKSTHARSLINHVSNVILFLWLLIGMVGGAKIISEFGNISYELSILLMVGVTFLYIILAGYKAVLITDILQAAIIFIFIVIITFAITGTNLSPLLAAKFEFSLASTLPFFLYGLLSVFAYSSSYQLCYASSSIKEFKKGLVFAIIPMFLFSILIFFIGAFMALHTPGLNPDIVFIEALKTFLNPALLPLAIIVFFAGVMSSADTNIYSISSHIALRKEKKDSAIRSIRIISVVLMLTIIIVAYFLRDIVDLSVFAASFTLISVTSMIYLLFGKTNKKRFIGSVYGGILGFILGLILVGLTPPLALTALGGSILGLFYNFKI